MNLEDRTLQRLEDRHNLQKAIDALSTYIHWSVQFESINVNERMEQYTATLDKLNFDNDAICFEIGSLIESLSDEEKSYVQSTYQTRKKNWK